MTLDGVARQLRIVSSVCNRQTKGCRNDLGASTVQLSYATEEAVGDNDKRGPVIVGEVENGATIDVVLLGDENIVRGHSDKKRERLYFDDIDLRRKNILVVVNRVVRGVPCA